MGAWGTGINSCDIAEDVRDACKEIYSFYDVEEGTKRVITAFQGISDQDFVDGEYASFWYAFAYWLWKHGMLNQEVKEKALQLLDDYAGLDEWEGSDVLKRKKALDKLKQQLLQPQSDMKKPRLKALKKKHAPGDVIIFKAGRPEFNMWEFSRICPSCCFESPKLRYNEFKLKDVERYSGNGKWMAVLCVGSVKIKHSIYVDDVFDEFELYVWYDYLSYEQPSLNDLKKCGFLPFIYEQLKDFNKKITEFAAWTYEFTLNPLMLKKSETIDEILTLQGTDEAERYKLLLSYKDYPYHYLPFSDCLDMSFCRVFQEKYRAMITGGIYDNLLDRSVCAPRLLPPEEITKCHAEFRKMIERECEEEFRKMMERECMEEV